MSDPIHPLDRLTISAWAIVHLHEIGELSEGVAVELMNSPDAVSYRLAREQCQAQMRHLLKPDRDAMVVARVERARQYVAKQREEAA